MCVNASDGKCLFIRVCKKYNLVPLIIIRGVQTKQLQKIILQHNFPPNAYTCNGAWAYVCFIVVFTFIAIRFTIEYG